MQHDDAIVSFEASAGLRDLVVGEGKEESVLDHPLDQQTFHIRMANSQGRREAASLLLKKMYGWRGYSVDPNATHSPHQITLFAVTGGQTVGTSTTTSGPAASPGISRGWGWDQTTWWASAPTARRT